MIHLRMDKAQPYTSALQVTLPIVSEVIHLNTAWDVALD